MKWNTLGITLSVASLACSPGSNDPLLTTADAGGDAGSDGSGSRVDADAPTHAPQPSMGGGAGAGGDGAGGTGAGTGGGAGASQCQPRRVGSGDQPLIDDFEDSDPVVIEIDGRRGVEFTYTEPTGVVAASTVDGAGPDASRALRFAGAASTPGYTGYALQLNNDFVTICPFDASYYRGIEFWGRSELPQETVGVHLQVAPNETCYATDPVWECFDSYFAEVSLGPDWQRYVLPWTDFGLFYGGPQPNSEAPANLVNLYEIQFVPQTNLGGFAILLDDVQFATGSCGNGVCDPDNPCPIDCCGNGSCEAFERPRASQLLSASGARSGLGLLYCEADCALPSAECPEVDLGSAVPQSVSGNTALSGSVLVGSCAASLGPVPAPGASAPPAPEATFLFTAPEAGTYVFDTRGSVFPSLVYVLDGVCGGAELACGNGSERIGEPSVVVPLVAGQTVTVVVDGRFGERGAFNLNVQRLEGICPDGDLGNSVPQQLSASTLGAQNSLITSCGELDSSDRTHLFSAPEAGLYRFTALGNFETSLSVRDGGCEGVELACSRGGPSAGQSQIVSELAAGQTIAVTVEGLIDQGDYTLSVDRVVCPQGDLGSQLPLSFGGSFEGNINASTGSCGGSFGPDVAVTWTAPVTGTYTFDTLGSTFDTLLYLIDGSSCRGPSLACDDDALPGLKSQVVIDLDQGQQVTVVIDSFGGTGTFALNIGGTNLVASDAGAPDGAP